MRLLSFCLTLFGILCIIVGFMLGFAHGIASPDWMALSSMSVIGLFALLLGYGLGRLAERRRVREYRLEPGDTGFIRAMMTRAARIQILLGVMLIPGAAFMVLAFWSERGWPLVGGAVLLLLFAGVIGMLLTIGLRTLRQARSGIGRILAETPERIERVNFVRLRRGNSQDTTNPGPAYAPAAFAEIAAGTDRVNVPLNEKYAALLRQYVAEHCSKAQISEEIRQA